MTNLESQFTGSDRQLRAQLNSLGTMLPTVQMHLIMCTTFSSTANKFEFLNMAYHLIDRLTALAHLTYPLRPGHSSDMATDYRNKYVQALEPVINTIDISDQNGSVSHARQDHSRTTEAGHGGASVTLNGGLANGGQLPGHNSHIPNSGQTVSKSLPTTPKHKSSARVEFQTEFPEHCQMFDGHMKVIEYNHSN